MRVVLGCFCEYNRKNKIGLFATYVADDYERGNAKHGVRITKKNWEAAAERRLGGGAGDRQNGGAVESRSISVISLVDFEGSKALLLESIVDK